MTVPTKSAKGSSEVSEIPFTGYVPANEPRELLRAQCIEYDFEKFVCSGDIPETRGIKDKMRRDDQYRMNSCAGFGLTNAAEVGWWLKTGDNRQFNPLWTYRLGQALDGIRGDNGATIHNVVQSGKRHGLLAEDVENDGKVEYPFPRDDYDFRFPSVCAEIAKKRTIGYSAELKSWQACVNFLQAGQGAIVIGGPWGNWRPNAAGVCDTFRGGGGGHARAYVDWIHIDGELMLVEANSHFTTYGDNGFGYHTQRFVDGQFSDRFFVAIGVSDITLGPGDEPKQRRHRRFVRLT